MTVFSRSLSLFGRCTCSQTTWSIRALRVALCFFLKHAVIERFPFSSLTSIMKSVNRLLETGCFWVIEITKCSGITWSVLWCCVSCRRRRALLPQICPQVPHAWSLIASTSWTLLWTWRLLGLTKHFWHSLHSYNGFLWRPVVLLWISFSCWFLDSTEVIILGQNPHLILSLCTLVLWDATISTWVNRLSQISHE